MSLSVLVDAAAATYSILSKVAMKKPSNSSKSGPRSLRDYDFVAQIADTIAPRSRIKPVDAETDAKVFNNRPTILIVQHNDSTSWIPLIPVLFRHFIKMMDRHKAEIYPSIFFHKIVHTLPLTKEISQQLVGNSVTSYKQVIELMNGAEPFYLATCPEGSNCLFQYESPVADFQQYGLLKAALATECNIVLVTFTQSRPFSWRVSVPYLDRLKDNVTGLRVPFYWITRASVDIRYEALERPMSAEQFNGLPKDWQNVALNKFADSVKALMETRFKQIGEGQI